jgi:hypothetical protein
MSDASRSIDRIVVNVSVSQGQVLLPALLILPACQGKSVTLPPRYAAAICVRDVVWGLSRRASRVQHVLQPEDPAAEILLVFEELPVLD